MLPLPSPTLPSPALPSVQLDVLALLLLTEVVQSCPEESGVWLPVLRQHAVLLQVVHLTDWVLRVSVTAHTSAGATAFMSLLLHMCRV